MNNNTAHFLLHCVPPLFVLSIVSVSLRFGPLYLSPWVLWHCTLYLPYRTSAAFNRSTKCGRDTNPVLSPLSLGQSPGSLSPRIKETRGVAGGPKGW